MPSKLQADEFDELAGRIEGVSQAVLHLAAQLETTDVIDGPQLSRWMRDAVPAHTTDTALRRTARNTLHQMARALDGARSSRQLQGGQ